MTDFPPGMPGSGERVDADPANFLRDMFLINDGRIAVHQVGNMIGRFTFTYGAAIIEAWDSLVADGFVVRDGDFWSWPIQEAMARRVT